MSMKILLESFMTEARLNIYIYQLLCKYLYEGVRRHFLDNPTNRHIITDIFNNPTSIHYLSINQVPCDPIHTAVLGKNPQYIVLLISHKLFEIFFIKKYYCF